MDGLISRQFEISEEIQKEYNIEVYSPESPYIIVNPFEVCPLSALIKFSTHKPCSIIINSANDIKQHFKQYNIEHELPIIGLFSDEVNKVEIICKYVDGTEEKFTHNILTDSLPSEFPNINVVVNNNEEMYPGMISMSLGKSDGVKTCKHLYSIIDKNARVRWLYTGVASHVFSKLKNGNLIIDAPISSGICGAYTAAGFVEIDFLGKIVNFFEIPNGLHHDVIELPNGNFLAITQRENSKQDLLVEINRESKKIIKEWDFREILDFDRKTVIDKISVNHPLDWLHLNSLVYDEKSNCIIASSRNQSCVVKFNKDTSEIKWIFAPPYNWKKEYQKYLLNPLGANFEWTWAQHTPVIDEEGNLLIFDNGNFRSYDLKSAVLAHNNYSRGVKYKIDEEKMTIEQIWQYGKQRGNKLYCPYLGAISLLPNSNKLLCFGGITRDVFGNPIDDMKSNRMKNATTIIEVSDTKVVFEISIEDSDITTASGYKCYRAEKISI